MSSKVAYVSPTNSVLLAHINIYQLILLVYAVPLAKRAQYQGLFGSVYGISSVIGPLICGAFTSNVSWRWAFYINVPFGGVVFIFVLFLLKVPGAPASKFTWGQKIQQLNIEGVIPLLGGVITLCLALQWGGFTYPVSSKPFSCSTTVIRETDRILVERWAYHRITYDCHRTFTCLHLDTGLEAKDSNSATSHHYPA